MLLVAAATVAMAFACRGLANNFHPEQLTRPQQCHPE